MEKEEEGEIERAAGATDTRHNHRRSAKTVTGNQGCLGNLALSIKHGHLRALHQSPGGNSAALGFRGGGLRTGGTEVAGEESRVGQR